MQVRISEMVFVGALAVFIAWALHADPVAVAGEQAVAKCPIQVRHVWVENGHYTPYPMLLPPDWDNARKGKDFYAEWKTIHGLDITVHCFSLTSETEVVKIQVPPSVTKCTQFMNEFSCVGNEAVVSPSPTQPK
ncbi:MAG: hypothetical protein H6922_03445 [Pseudomonadaceae bacterium]|nr:hypothetical protein [Pseudomonadaceae bacterium]